MKELETLLKRKLVMLIMLGCIQIIVQKEFIASQKTWFDFVFPEDLKYAKANIEKLEARYQGQFSSEKSINRKVD